MAQKSNWKAFRQSPGDNTGLIQFSVFTNDLKAKVEHNDIKFAADISLGDQEEVMVLENRGAVQRVLNTLED